MDKLLSDKSVFPTDLVIQAILANVFSVFKEFTNIITSEKYSLNYEWRYYNDGKRWLMKICFKKKTIIWLSVNEGCFSVTFYFANRPDIDLNGLKISTELKQQFSENRIDSKKLTPLTIHVKTKKQLTDIYSIIDHKKSLK